MVRTADPTELHNGAQPPPAVVNVVSDANWSNWRALYPFTSRWFERDGLRMHYLDEGKGPPVVMVHGNPTWSFYYRSLINELRTTHRCIVPDHIGCGLSDKPGDDEYPYTVERRVEDLEALLDKLRIERGATFIVHDWGGMIGLATALRRPLRVARIVVLNTAAFLLPPGKRFPLRLRLLHRRNKWTEFAVRGLNLFSWPATWMATAKGLPRAVKAGLMAPYDSWASRIATLRFVQDIPTRPRHRSYAFTKWVDDNLASLSDKPMMICWGGRDFVFDVHFLNEWQRRFPNAEVHRFADAGHYVLEDARERVVALVRAFLGRTSAVGE
jgi:cis-3-alkyl-4-acyloxetan-2-one decarboxylase